VGSTSTPDTALNDDETSEETSEAGNDDPPLDESVPIDTPEPANDSEPASPVEPVIANPVNDNPQPANANDNPAPPSAEAI